LQPKVREPRGLRFCRSRLLDMVRIFQTEDGSKIAVGENAAENEELCKRANQRDIWFHLENAPSPHAILSVEGKGGPSRDSIIDAQQLVKYFSKRRDTSSASVIWIEAKFVSGGKEDKLGAVGLKKKPSQALVVFDERTMMRLLATKE
jgi:predicted ribosome quality control (RQC) complex YloA/Tae2 family protein